MLSITHLDIRYGNKHLFKNVSAQVHSGERIGLVGVNGTGKSTLLKTMSGDLEADPGVVSRAGWFTVAYLPQEVILEVGNRTLYEEAITAFDELLILQREVEEIEHKLSTMKDGDSRMDKFLDRLGDLQHQIEGHDVYQIKSQTEKILGGLGFSEDDFTKDVNSFSGGWIMRLLLAKLLLRKPSLLLLDEPTNHLDLQSLTWLEDFLESYDGGMVIISHDRTFLDRITAYTWELSLGNLTVYRGNYSSYLLEKEQRLEIEQAAWANQQAKIKQTERFIERFRSKSTKARQVQSRVKQLAKMERVELSSSEKKVNFSFPTAAPSGKQILEMRGLGKQFAGKTIFSGADLNLIRGDKLAIVGVNGAGKTTFLKILDGQIPADEGEVQLGHNVIKTYFGQHQARELSGSLTVLETLYHRATDMTMTRVRSLLGAFLFSGDDVDKKVSVLSGGEKSRLALAGMLVQPANLMLLDEPTNHLDMSSQEVLQDAMAQYEGTIIVVSHNRYFVNQFVNKVLEIRDGKVRLFEGNIDEYLECCRREEAGKLEGNTSDDTRKEQARKRESGKNRRDKKGLRRQRARNRQEMNKKFGPLKKKAKEAEKKIEALEVKKQELEALMSDPNLYGDQVKWAATSQDYERVNRHLDRYYHQWEKVQEQIEIIEQELEQK